MLFLLIIAICLAGIAGLEYLIWAVFGDGDE